MDVSERVTMPAKVSPVDAAVAALLGAGEDRPWRTRLLDGAEVGWCRALSIPTVRDIARLIDRAPSTVVSHGGLVALYAEVIRREWSLLDDGWFSAHPRACPAFFRSHVGELRARDPVLLRLPGLVLAAVTSAGLEPPPQLTVPWFSLAAFATSPVDVGLRLSA